MPSKWVGPILVVGYLTFFGIAFGLCTLLNDVGLPNTPGYWLK